MAIVGGVDTHWRYSINTSPGNSTAQVNPNDSLGGYMSLTNISSGVPLNNIFDDITGDENAASESEYRCIFVVNEHATLTWSNVRVWLYSEVAGGANISLGVEVTPTQPTAKNSGSAQAQRIANENVPPSGITFFTGAQIDTKAEGLGPFTLAPNQAIAIWVRRTAANTGALDNDGMQLRVEGDSAA